MLQTPYLLFAKFANEMHNLFAAEIYHFKLAVANHSKECCSKLMHHFEKQLGVLNLGNQPHD
jgi:hypothetical protein